MAALQIVPLGLLPAASAQAAAQSQPTQYEYDAQGNLTKVTDPNGKATTLTSDSLNRVQTQTLPPPTAAASAPVVSYTYDGQNRLLSVKDPNGVRTVFGYFGLQDVALTTPSTGFEQKQYDALGDLSYRSNQRSQSLSVASKDALNRPLLIWYTDENSGNYTGASLLAYDEYSTTAGSENYGRGHLTRVVDYGIDSTGAMKIQGSVSMRYDQLGRLSRLCQYWQGTSAGGYTNCQDGDALRYRWGPNSGTDAGRLLGLTYPSGRKVDYQYDSLGRIQGITTTTAGSSSAQSVASQVTYTPLSVEAGQYALSGLTFGASGGTQKIQRFYDTSGRLETYTLGQGALGMGSLEHLRSLTWDDAGRVTAIQGISATNQVKTASFEYDDLNRLKKATLPGSVIYSYDYDLNGNRTLKVSGSVTTNYTYPTTSNRLNAVQVGSAASQALSYDDTGNITQDPATPVGAVTYTYSDGNNAIYGRLTKSQGPGAQWDYTHNYFGQRIRKQGSNYTPTGGSALTPAAYIGSTDTLFYYDADGHLIAEADGSAGTSVSPKPIKREYIWLGDMLVGIIAGATPTAAISASNAATLYYVHSDHLNTPRMVTDTAGNRRWTWDTLGAEPFGVTAANEAPASQAAAQAFTLNLRFPGQYLDKETGSFYNYFRTYNPNTGRYLQSDPIGLQGGLNTYAYVEGNPLSKIDPLGLETYLCSRPLDGFHGVSVGPLYHQFICTLDANGKVQCGGLGPKDGADGMFGGKGTIEPEKSVSPEQCQKERGPDKCFEDCVKDHLASPAPDYDVRAGRSWLLPKSGTQQCQVYARSVLDQCSAKCGKK